MKQGSQNNSTALGNRIFNMAQGVTNQFAAGPPQHLMQNEIMMVQQPAFQKSFTTKEGSPLSVVSRWLLSDPSFMNKYSSGATPPNKRASKLSAALNKKSQSLYQKRPVPSEHEQRKMTNGLILSPNENDI